METNAGANVLSDLVKKLPAIQRWIDDVLARSRPFATRIDLLGLPRLSSFYAPETLRSVSMLEVDKVPVPPLVDLGLQQFADFERIDFEGITYQDVYFIRHGEARNEALHFHELVHAVQWRLLGPARFILAYALGHAMFGGYANNPLENMAYELQGRFESNEPPFSVEPVVKQNLEPLLPALFGPSGG